MKLSRRDLYNRQGAYCWNENKQKLKNFFFKILILEKTNRFPQWLSGKKSAWQDGSHGFDSWFGNIPWKEMATPSSILAWEIPWTEEPGGLQSTGSQRSQALLRTKRQHYNVNTQCWPMLGGCDYRKMENVLICGRSERLWKKMKSVIHIGTSVTSA